MCSIIVAKVLDTRRAYQSSRPFANPHLLDAAADLLLEFRAKR